MINLPNQKAWFVKRLSDNVISDWWLRYATLIVFKSIMLVSITFRDLSDGVLLLQARQVQDMFPSVPAVVGCMVTVCCAYIAGSGRIVIIVTVCCVYCRCGGYRICCFYSDGVLCILQVRQVQDVFPSMPAEVILTDLRITHSVEMTIENIIEERLTAPPPVTSLILLWKLIVLQ